MAMDGGQDALACKRGYLFGAAESSGNRCNAQMEFLGEIMKSHGAGKANDRAQKTVGLTTVLPEL